MLPEQGNVDAERHCATLDYVKVESVIGTCGRTLRRCDVTASQKSNVMRMKRGRPYHSGERRARSCARPTTRRFVHRSKSPCDGVQSDRTGDSSPYESSWASHRRGTTNVHADLDYRAPQTMFVKAQLVSRIAEILAEDAVSRTQAASALGIPQPKLSKILRGQFRGLSERKLIDCLTQLGHASRL